MPETGIYRAPALEKGLDIIELLAETEDPLTLAAIAAQLDRSHTEIFRMVQVLESRGFLSRDNVTDGYIITERLFSLAIRRPVLQTLFEAALPAMRALATESGHSCHLAVHSRGDMVVVARMESSELLGFAVRIGYRQPLISTTSGIVLFAFQDAVTRKRWRDQMRPVPSADAMNGFCERAELVKAAGIAEQPSGFVSGVIDMTAPVLRGQTAAAALTIPFLKLLQPQMEMADVRHRLMETASSISKQLHALDNRA